MSIEFEARAEAEKRYPVIPDAPFGDSASVSVKRKAFVAGYIAGASRPVTDAEVERAAMMLASDDESDGKLLWERELSEDVKDYVRTVARQTLEAARTFAGKETP